MSERISTGGRFRGALTTTSPGGRPTIRVGPPGGRTVVWLAGEQDRWSQARLADALGAVADRAGSGCTIDVRGVTFLDASIARVLVRMRARFEAEHRTLTVRGPSSIVLRTLQIFGLDGLIDDPEIVVDIDDVDLARLIAAPGER